MNKWLFLLFVLILSIAATLGHGEEKVGILVDAECGAQIAGDVEKTAAHTVSCALSSREAGYGIVSEGKFLKFDDFGNKQAALLLKATEGTSSPKVRVEGHFEEDLVIVSTIETVD
jgi:hypothetical protein